MSVKRGDVVNYRGVSAEVLEVGPQYEWVEQWDGSDAEVEVLAEGDARIVKIGDDQMFTVPADEYEVIDEDDYCPGCGQVGCHAYE